MVRLRPRVALRSTSPALPASQSGSPRTAPKHHDLSRRQRGLRGGVVPSVPPIRVGLALPVVRAFCRPLRDPGFCRGPGYEVGDRIWDSTPLSYLNGIA
jgi:hypothetical protein